MRAERTFPPLTPVRAARLAVPLSQEQLAERAGVPRSLLSLAEITGHLTRRTAERLAPVLHVEPEALLPNARRNER